jgi:hypothetical protein
MAGKVGGIRDSHASLGNVRGMTVCDGICSLRNKDSYDEGGSSIYGMVNY